MQPLDPAAFLVAHLPLVETVVADVARRQRVRGDDLAEFRSLSYLKLIDHDYEALRRFRGHSSLRTYVTVVLQRVLLDHRNRQWGRWRPSATAQRSGPAAVQLERLVTRDGLTPQEAVSALGPDANVCGRFVESLAERRTERGDRRPLGEDAIPDRMDTAPGPEERTHHREVGAQAAAVRSAVEWALRALDSEDHLIITLRFRDGLAVPDIARVLGLDAKPLYRRIGQILERLHDVLGADASADALARGLAGENWSDFAPGESGWWRPSNPQSESEAPSVEPWLAGERVPRARPARRVHRRPAPAAAQPLVGAASV